MLVAHITVHSRTQVTILMLTTLDLWSGGYALVEAIHGADFHTIHQLAFDATLIDYIGHKTSLPDGQAVPVAAYAAGSVCAKWSTSLN